MVKLLYLKKNHAMKNLLFIISILFVYSAQSQMSNPELVIGEERVDPGIIFIFEGAIKDHVMPEGMHLSENETNIHIEARVNWDTQNIPQGAVENGFVPYLHINAKIINENTGLSTFIDLVPHINLVDNFHYARNISLPGSIDDIYSVRFNVISPTKIDLSIHKDWLLKYGEALLKDQSFYYQGVNFKEIAKARRK